VVATLTKVLFSKSQKSKWIGLLLLLLIIGGVVWAMFLFNLWILENSIEWGSFWAKEMFNSKDGRPHVFWPQVLLGAVTLVLSCSVTFATALWFNTETKTDLPGFPQAILIGGGILLTALFALNAVQTLAEGLGNDLASFFAGVMTFWIGYTLVEDIHKTTQTPQTPHKV
jgi:hypothetical protein